MGDLEEVDLPLIGGDETPDIAAILLGIVLDSPEDCPRCLERLMKQLRRYDALRLTDTARLRVPRGRLISAIE